MADNTIHQVAKIVETPQPISKQIAMRLTAEELRFITIRRQLTDDCQELLMGLAESFVAGEAQRGETPKATRPKTTRRPKASTLRLVPRS
jgi:hypothetical protein